MIRRILVNHFRCFQNLEIKLNEAPSILLLGKNGVGKSTLGTVLSVLQKIGSGTNRLKDLIGADDYAQGDTGVPIRIEMEAIISAQRFEYTLVVELPIAFHESRIMEESLKVDGQPVFTRNLAEVAISKTSTNFLVDWHFVALPVVQIRPANNPIDIFKNWLARMVIVAPIPELMSGSSSEETLQPERNGSNFASWFSGLLGQYPASYSVVEKYLRGVMPDFQDFENRPYSDDSKKLFVRFSQNESSALKLDFKNLSDGEKSFFFAAVVLGANKFYGPLFIFWDEPDNYLSLSEVGHLIIELRRNFERSGQLIISSHNPEAVRKFSDVNTLVLTRNSHMEPTRPPQWLKELNVKGDLVEALIRGDVANGT